MDHRETERITVRMAEMQPCVPDWCKAEHMEMSVPQKELWRYRTNNQGNMVKRIVKCFFGRHKRRERKP